MSKFKVLGIASFILGIIQILIPLAMIFVVIPRISSLYVQFETPPPVINVYLKNFAGIIWGAAGIFFGRKMHVEKGKKLEKYFNWALIYIVLSFLIGSVIAGFTVLSVIAPIYSLSSSL